MKKVFCLVLFATVLLVALPLVSGQSFPDDWTGSFDIAANNTQVSSDESDFAYYYDLSNIPSASPFWSEVQGNGGDLRVTTDSAGNNLVPLEVVSINVSAKTGEIHFKNETNSSSDESYYLWAGTNGTTSQPAVTGTYGRNNVWTKYQGVWHLGESSGTTAVDSTGNGNDGTFQGDLPTQTSSQLGDGQDLDGTGDFIDSTSLGAGFLRDEFTLSIWGKLNAVSSTNTLMGKWTSDQVSLDVLSDGTINFNTYNGASYKSASSTGTVDDDTFHHITGRYSNSNNEIKVFIDGANDGSNTDNGQLSNSSANVVIGALKDDGTQATDGQLDEARVTDGNILSDGWIGTEYNMQNDNSGFWIEGTWTPTNPVTLENQTLTPSPAQEDSVLTTTADYQHYDGNPANVTVSWLNNTGGTMETDTITNLASGSLINETIDLGSYSISNGDNITATINATDANNNSVEINATVTIQNKGTLVVGAKEKITNDTINTFNTTTPVNASTTNGTITIDIAVGNYTVTANADDSNYLNTISESNVEVLFDQTTTVNLSGFYNTNISTDVKDARDNSTINTYDVAVTNGTYTETTSTTSNDATIGVLTGDWNVTVENASEGGNEFARSKKNYSNITGQFQSNHSLRLTNSFFITFKDEETDEVIDDRNVTIEYLSEFEAFDQTTENGQTNITGLIPSIVELQYNAPGYDERSYFHFLNNQSTTNLTLYLLNQTSSSLVITTSEDQSGVAQEEVTVILKRGYIEDNQTVFRTVAMDDTDFGGEAPFNLVLNDVNYKWLIVDNVEDNTVLFRSSDDEVTSTSLSFTLEVGGDPLETFNYITGQGTNALITTDPEYNNQTKLWSASYELTESNTYAEICLQVEEINDFGKRVVSEECTTANAATITNKYNDTQSTIASLLLKKQNGDSILLAKQQYLTEQPWTSGGSNGVVATAWIVSTIGLAFLNSPVTLIIAGTFGLLAAIAMGFFGLSWLAFLPVLITGGLLIFKMLNRSSTGGRAT